MKQKCKHHTASHRRSAGRSRVVEVADVDQGRKDVDKFSSRDGLIQKTLFPRPVDVEVLRNDVNVATELGCGSTTYVTK